MSSRGMWLAFRERKSSRELLLREALASLVMAFIMENSLSNFLPLEERRGQRSVAGVGVSGHWDA